jgi:ribulose-5-phosphate 4-epimerase/fuculose-1-phosphate aldolase
MTKPISRNAMTRRGFLGSGLALPAAILAARTSPTPAPTEAERGKGLVADLVAANRILAFQGLVSGFGHVSARDEHDPRHYLISRSLAPQLVTARDILTLDLDSRPADGRKHSLYVERYLHGEIYKARPDVRAIVHTHSPCAITFGISSVVLQPAFHMAGFIGEGVPVFDIRRAVGGSDMLISHPRQGRALTGALGAKPAILLRGHGAVLVGESLPVSVGRAVYLEENAMIQMQAIALGGAVTYLDRGEVDKRVVTEGYGRAWDLWKKEAFQT